MKLKIYANGYERHAELLLRNISERVPVECTEGGLEIVFSVNAASGPEESYEILCDGSRVTVMAADGLGLSHGIGKLLHTAQWNEVCFVPAPPKGGQIPACTFRAMYFSVHNYNWYHITKCI